MLRDTEKKSGTIILLFTNVRSPSFFNSTDTKRRLMTNTNIPSTYIEPPLDSAILFFNSALQRKEK
jgi:hypothetical protein